MSLCTIVGMGTNTGLSVARRFAKEGYDISMISRTENSLRSYQKTLKQYKVNVHYSVADVSNHHELISSLNDVADKTNVLIYNAAVVEKSSFSDLKDKKLLDDFKINVIGAWICSQFVLPKMCELKQGTIIYTGGSFAHDPNSKYVSLSLGKAALWNLGMNLFKEYSSNGIHIGLITVSGKIQKRTKYDPDLIAEEYWKLHNQPRKEWEFEINI